MKDKISELLRPEIVLDVDIGCSELVVREDDRSAKLRQLRVKNVPHEAAAFVLDYTPNGHLSKTHKNAFKQLSCFIHREHSRANKKCDFVLIFYQDGKWKIVLADMKSESPNKSDCKKQLRNSEIYVTYLMQLLSEYHDINGPLDFYKAIFYALPGINAKAPTNQKNTLRCEAEGDVLFVGLPLGGRNNESAIVSLRTIVPH